MLIKLIPNLFQTQLNCLHVSVINIELTQWWGGHVLFECFDKLSGIKYL